MNEEVEKQRTREEGNEPSSPGDKKPERATSEYKHNNNKVNVLFTSFLNLFLFCCLQVHHLALTPNSSDRISKVIRHL